jgi:hypothetical protein
VAWWQRWVDRWLSAGVRSSASTPSPFKMGAAEVGSVNQKRKKKKKIFYQNHQNSIKTSGCMSCSLALPCSFRKSLMHHCPPGLTNSSIFFLKFAEMRWNRAGPNSKISEFWNLNLKFLKKKSENT